MKECGTEKRERESDEKKSFSLFAGAMHFWKKEEGGKGEGRRKKKL